MKIEIIFFLVGSFFQCWLGKGKHYKYNFNFGPILIIWMSPLSFLGESGVFFFIFISYFDDHVSKQNSPDGTPRFVASVAYVP